MNVKSILFLAVLSMTAFSCSNLKPFTQGLLEENKWSETELKKIQFYLSEDIRLTRQITGGSSEIIAGEIRVVNGRKVEQIIIEKGTPGVLLFRPRQDRFAVSFEADGSDKFLIFGPSNRSRGRYVLKASDWERRFGTVTYDGKKYRVDASSSIASLMVDLEKIQRTDVNSRRASGRTVGN
ncbi:MAG: hypothetical protein MRY78_06205 [Saprospiraceae bacterium]|nr:hypothetical protein [Saprospiraceae bacterium]